MTCLPSMRLSIVTAAVLLAATPSLAQDAGYFYGGLSVGLSKARIDEDRITASLLSSGLTTTSMSRDESDTGYKAFAGYQFNRYVGLEGGYFNLGKFGFTSTTAPAGTLQGDIKLQGLNLDIVGAWPLGDRFSLIGRVGAQYARARDHFSGTGVVTVLDPDPQKNELNPKFGVGLQYELSRSFLVRAEAERYRVNDAVGNHGGVNLFSLSLVVPFGRAEATAPRLTVAAPAPPPRPAPPPPAPPPRAMTPPPATMAAPPRRVDFSADSLFAFDSAVVQPKGRAALEAFAREIGGVRYDTIGVEGHTDRLGSAAYNEALSRRRAEAVKAVLIAAGIDAARISATGKGESSPVTGSEDCKGHAPGARLIACLQPDRRVSVVVSGTMAP